MGADGAAKLKSTVVNTDMAEDMQKDAVECALAAMEKFNMEKDMAAFLKKEFDKKYSPTWNCIVGKSYGAAFVTEKRGGRLCGARMSTR
mmetsp:Transcript_9734/g.34570  ORF Transcript_9734/g.34570 Transcript_9734/m.34570 type:complete len:89 (+) Transcript_9734:148-414(+)